MENRIPTQNQIKIDGQIHSIILNIFEKCLHFLSVCHVQTLRPLDLTTTDCSSFVLVIYFPRLNSFLFHKNKNIFLPFFTFHVLYILILYCTYVLCSIRLVRSAQQLQTYASFFIFLFFHLDNSPLKFIYAHQPKRKTLLCMSTK